MKKVSPVRFGKYLLLDPIAVGGMAELFRAKMVGDEGFEKVLVVKKILPHMVDEQGLVDAFINEARLAANLQHENIVRTFDFGKMGGDYFIAMEYLFGKNLRMVLDRGRQLEFPMSLVNVLYIAMGMVAGLDYAHSLADFSGKPLDIVHRDISPPNIFLTYNGQVKVVDFGVAKAASQIQKTRLGVIKGKVAYMSPEQADGKPVDKRTDIFALGAVLYELVTGKRMFTGETMEVLAKVRKAEFEPPENLVPDLHPRLSAILNKALDKDIEQRYQTCAEMLADLEDCVWEMTFRPSGRALGRYMQELFSDQIPEEEKDLRLVLALGTVGKIKQDEPEWDATTIMVETDPLTKEKEVQGGQEGIINCPNCSKPMEKKMPFCPWCGSRTSVDGTRAVKKPSKPMGLLKKKVCLLGAASVGKTSILRRFAHSTFEPNHLVTLGAWVETKTINLEGRVMSLDVWDMGALDRFHDLNMELIEDMDAYILVFDCTRSSTLEAVNELYQDLEKKVGRKPFVCAVNKTDQTLNWDVSRKTLDELSEKGWPVVRTSALTGVGITRAFMSLAEEILLAAPEKSVAVDPAEK